MIMLELKSVRGEKFSAEKNSKDKKIEFSDLRFKFRTEPKCTMLHLDEKSRAELENVGNNFQVRLHGSFFLKFLE